MKQVYLLLFSLFMLLGSSNAQTNIASYQLTKSSGTYTAISGGTVLWTTWDNNVSTAVSLGGTFTYGGTAYTTCYVSSNGFITFGAAPSSSNYTPLSTTAASVLGVIAAFAQDGASSTAPGSSPEISYATVGSEFVVQFKDHSNYYGLTTERLNAQIRLNLTTNAINIVYGSFTAPGSATNGVQVQVGLRGNTTTWADNVNNLKIGDIPSGTTCNWANAVTGNANNSNLLFSSANTAVVPTNGFTLTWTSATTPAPARVFAAVTGITTTGATVSWTAPSGAAQYNVQYRIPGTCSWTAYSGNPVSGTSVNLTGLAVSTSYQVRVQAFNGSNLANWSHIPDNSGIGDGYTTTGTFTTLCNPTQITVTEGFNSTTIPSCWLTKIVAVQTGTKISFPTTGSYPTTAPYEGTNMVMYNSYSNANGGAGSEERLISLPLSTTGKTSVDVTFYWRNENNTSYSTGAYLNEGVQIQYSLDGNTWTNAGSFFARHDGTLAAGTAQWNKKTVTLPSNAGNVPLLFVGFKFHSEWGDNLFLDLASMLESPCSGTPNPGNTVAIPATVCPGSSTVLHLQNQQAGSGITYQWQKAPDNSGTPGTYANVGTSDSTFTDNPAASSWYRCVVTCANSMLSSTSTAVLVTVLPNTATAGATPNPVCPGSTLNLSSTGGDTYSWSGPNGFTSTLQNPSIVSVTSSNAGVYTVTATNACGGHSASVNVTVSAGVNATASATPNPVCQNGTLNLSSSGGTSYSWSGPNGFTSTLQNPSIPGITTLGAGTYTVFVSSTSCGSGTASVVVTVNALPTPTATATPNPVCSGSTLSLGATGGSTYAWSGPNSFVSTLQNPTISNITTSGSGNYLVTVTSAAGCSATASVSVTVNASPSATATATPNPICIGATLTLNATGGGTYAWSGPNSFASTAQAPTIANITAAAAGIYNVTVTAAAGGCTATASVNVTVNPLPTPTATGTPNPICAGGTLQLSSSGGATYAWSGPNGYGNTVQNPSIVIAGTNQGGVYTVTVTSAAGCSATATLNVTVNAAPTATATATPNPLCAGGTLQLTATGGGTYAWTGPASFTSTLSNPTRPNALVTYSGVYRVTVTSGAGCSSITSVNAVVNPLPVTVITAVTNPICSGQTAILYANGASKYVWSTGATTSTINVTPTTTTTYTVTGTAGTCSSTASFVLTVNPSPTITVNPANIDICINDTITLSGGGGTKYAWSTGETTNTIKVHPREATTYIVTGTAANGCTGKATSTLTVKDFEASVTATKASICEGETITLTATGGTAYSWTPGNASGSSINVRPTVSTNYRVRITGANGCIKYLEIYIEVFPKPIVYINDVKSTVPPPICPGTEVDLRAGGAYSYLWTPDSIPGRIITVAPKTTTRYTVTGSNIWGCTSTASINIPVFAPTSARIEPSTGKDPICKGKELTLTVIGLTKPVWWPGKQTTNSITMVPKDIVYAEVTGFDANGCLVTLVFEARTIYCKDGGLVSDNGRSIISDINVAISPNPMRETANFRFEAPTNEEMTLKVMTIDGRVIRSERIAKGLTNYELNKDNAASGMYFYQLITTNGEIAKTGKLVIIE